MLHSEQLPLQPPKLLAQLFALSLKQGMSTSASYYTFVHSCSKKTTRLNDNELGIQPQKRDLLGMAGPA